MNYKEENTNMKNRIFSEKLMELRKQKGWSQEALGEAVGVSRQTVSKWELSETTPEMEKLIEISRLFDISIDELVGNESRQISEPEEKDDFPRKKSFGFEYKSKKTLGRLPLVHINLKGRARGVFAVGQTAVGLVSLGFASLGLFSAGLASLGLISVGLAALGLVAVGLTSVGVLAVGGAAVGFFAIGGVAVGAFSIGGLAVAGEIAMGGYAKSANIAIGGFPHGKTALETIGNGMELTKSDAVLLKEAIHEGYSRFYGILVAIFCHSK